MDDAGVDPRDQLKRVLRLPDAVFLVVASVIGSGIFLTPGAVAALLPHPGWILAAWLALNLTAEQKPGVSFDSRGACLDHAEVPKQCAQPHSTLGECACDSVLCA